MDAAILPSTLIIIAVAALAVLIVGIVQRRRLLERIERALREVPRDLETGLFDRSVCLQRVAAELKRARRSGGTVWVAVITVIEGDAARVGRLLHDSMRPPEVGFRLDDQVICIARPDLGVDDRIDLLGRIVAASPRERIAIGETTWRGRDQDGDATTVLRAASAATQEVTTP